MARTQGQIEQQILSSVSQNIPQLNSVSQVAIYKLWSYIISVSQATEEQLYDQLVLEVEDVVNQLATGTPNWIVANAYKFQYSSTTPQIIQFNPTTLTPYYPTVNTNYRIITNVSVSVGPMNPVQIKVAKDYSATTLPNPLSSDESAAFQFYMNQIKVAGVVYNCLSIPADRLFFGCTVYYQGGYSSTIANDLLTAYQTFLKNIPFDSKLILVDLLGALRQVKGVNDIYINNAQLRPYSLSFGTGLTMVNSNTWIVPESTCLSGYCVDENHSGSDFLSSLVLIPN